MLQELDNSSNYITRMINSGIKLTGLTIEKQIYKWVLKQMKTAQPNSFDDYS